MTKERRRIDGGAFWFALALILPGLAGCNNVDAKEHSAFMSYCVRMHPELRCNEYWRWGWRKINLEMNGGRDFAT